MKYLTAFVSMLFSGLAAAANQAVLTWDYDMVAYPTATFNVYQCQGAPGCAKTQVASGITAKTATLTTGFADGKRYCFEVTAVVGSDESGRSNEACKTFPQAPATLTVK
jgi:hypothetical protein